MFLSLIKNLPKMFPRDILECELSQDDISQDFFLVIRRTTAALKAKSAEEKDRELKYLELQKFLHAKNLGHESAADSLKQLL